MKRRRTEQFEQPSLVPMADMVTNTVGIMLFILIFVSLSAGGVVVARHVPREKHTEARAVWIYCSGGRIAYFDAEGLGKQMADRSGDPSATNAGLWAMRYSNQRIQTDVVEAAGDAFLESGGHLSKSVLIRRRSNRGEDEAAIKNPDSAFQKLLAEKSRSANFFYFFVDPNSIHVFLAAREQATQAGFNAGWTPLDVDAPARISLSGGGREANIQ